MSSVSRGEMQFSDVVRYLRVLAARYYPHDMNLMGLGEHPDYYLTAIRAPSLRLENGAFIFCDRIAQILLVLSRENPGSFDYVAKVCGYNISLGEPLPAALRMFPAMVLNGEWVRPPDKSRRTTDYIENVILRVLLDTAVDHGGLSRTRNDAAAKQESACDAVQAAVYSLGRWVPFERLKKLCTSRHAQLAREAAEWRELAERDDGWSFHLRIPYQRPCDYVHPARLEFEVRVAAAIGTRPGHLFEPMWTHPNGGAHGERPSHHQGSL